MSSCMLCQDGQKPDCATVRVRPRTAMQDIGADQALSTAIPTPRIGVSALDRLFELCFVHVFSDHRPEVQRHRNHTGPLAVYGGRADRRQSLGHKLSQR